MLALLAERYCEVIHTHERIWVLLPEHRLPELQCLPVHGLSRCVLALLAKRRREIHHAPERAKVILPEHLSL